MNITLSSPCLALALGLLGTAACNPSVPTCRAVQAPAPPAPEYVLVEHRTASESATAPKVEVKETPKYQSTKGKLRAAAIRLPDTCLNETAARVTGVAQRTDLIFQTKCGSWLSEIEKALATAGFKVYSWDALYKLEIERRLSPYNAGKMLGADVVFVFNSLEAGDIKGGASMQGRFRYFNADARGRALSARPLDEATRDQFKAFAQGALKDSVKPDQVIALSSIIDSTAVLTESGESVWFYRRVLTMPVKENAGMKFLFGRYPGTEWKVVSPALLPAISKPRSAPLLSTEESVESSVGVRHDAYEAMRLDLIRAGASDFVQAFRGGKP